MKHVIICLAVLSLSGTFIFGQGSNSGSSPILLNPVKISTLPKIIDREIRVNLDTQYLEAWSKRGRKWKRVLKFPIVIGGSDALTPIGKFYIYHKENEAVNSNGSSLGRSLDFVMRKNRDQWRILAIHGWVLDVTGKPGWGPTEGCIQLLRNDMNTLYRWARKGTPVIIE
jgi:lipoprotein-anchoring transpeptidase ErfK/SrfK